VLALFFILGAWLLARVPDEATLGQAALGLEAGRE
jgi:hypothetical protein